MSRNDGGMYQCFVFGHSNNDIAIGSSQLDLGGKQYFLSTVSKKVLSDKFLILTHNWY